MSLNIGGFFLNYISFLFNDLSILIPNAIHQKSVLNEYYGFKPTWLR